MASRGNPEWKPGTSGNPSGRRPLPEWFRKKGEEYLKHLDAVATGKIKDPHVSQYEAAKDAVERIWGKPTQAIDAEVNDRRIIEVIRSIPDDKL